MNSWRSSDARVPLARPVRIHDCDGTGIASGTQNRFFAPLRTTLAVFALAAASAAAANPDFDRDVRPILSDKCFHCHGPDAEKREADLRLDVRAVATESAIVPGQPDASELIARITSEDESTRMPPSESKLALTDAEKHLLRDWIAAGAQYTEHWSFRPLSAKVDLPPVKFSDWPRQPLDRFVMARLEAEGLRPSPQANPLRLLRRMTLDLTGLPPTRDEIETFQQAAASDLNAALESAADRLLASPSFGEHMAVAWLDAARYADSYGYQSDQLNTQWPYRDWVVRAFNDNLPYNDFLTWQLAGDLLENATRDQVLATAFNRMHRMTNEGGSIAEEWLAENAADRVHTMGAAMLGLTLECARCHDHKYDPILTRDYYSLSAFFNSIDENGMYDATAKVPTPSLLLPTEDQETRLDAAREKVAQAEAAVKKVRQEGEDRFQEWLSSSSSTGEPADLIGRYSFDGELATIANEAPGMTAAGAASELSSVESPRGRAVRFDGDHGVTFPELLRVDRWDAFTLDIRLRGNARNPLPVVVAHRTHGTDVGPNGFDLMLQDGVLAARFYRVWPGNAIGVEALEPIAHGEWQHIAATYDGSSRAAGLRLYLNGHELKTRVLHDRMVKCAAPATFGAGHFTLGERFRDRGFKDGEIDDFSAYSRALTSLEIRQLHDADQSLASSPPTADDQAALRETYFSAVDAQAREATNRLREARQQFVAVENEIHEVSVMAERADPRPTYILPRGAYDAPQTDANRVTRDVFQEMLSPYPEGAPRDRLGLARWLTAPDHPLAARVAVNRLWTNFFGRGLVATPENFGRQGAAPTHPDLLDWLARDFVDHNWDVKRLCRNIVLSATYRQDSRASAELRDRDPENMLLARGPSRRLSAEQIRDLALTASGLLDAERGGPPVSPYQPGGDLWRESNSMSPAYQQSTGKSLHRRSLYSVWKRTAPLPNMTVFDATSREVCTIARGRTSTPLQALVLLNDVQFLEAARGLAASATLNDPDPSAQITNAFLRLTSRPPSETELNLLVDLYNEQRTQFADAAIQDPAKLLAIGELKSDANLNAADLAALTVTCQAIMNLDATIYER